MVSDNTKKNKKITANTSSPFLHVRANCTVCSAITYSSCYIFMVFYSGQNCVVCISSSMVADSTSRKLTMGGVYCRWVCVDSGVCVCLQRDDEAGWKQALSSAQLVCAAALCSTTSLVTSTAGKRARLNSTRYHHTFKQWGGMIIQVWVKLTA